MIILALLHADDRTPIQWWTFHELAPITIGRAFSNQVIIRDSLVSRHHCELQPVMDAGETLRWMLVNRGKNGTFLNGQGIESAMSLSHGSLVQLAPKGPLLKVYLREVLTPGTNKLEDASSDRLQLLQPQAVQAAAVGAERVPARTTTPSLAVREALRSEDLHTAARCKHEGNPAGNLFCIHCGQPIKVLRHIRQYQVLRVLGQGGMGTTFLAWLPQPLGAAVSKETEREMDRLVVVKQMNPEMATIPKAQELFEREALTLRTLSHPGIPRFLDAFTEQRQSYLVMELVHGQDLERYVRQRGAVSIPQAINWLMQVCDVLHYLHTQTPPVLHRDIKPANLLRRQPDGKIIVVDFGAVKTLSSPMGTCIKADGYTAPEQEEGNPQIESDLYSVGATLIFLLTGKNPLDSMDIHTGRVSLRFDGLGVLPDSLVTVLERLMAWDPYERYASSLELKQALGCYWSAT